MNLLESRNVIVVILLSLDAEKVGTVRVVVIWEGGK